MGWRKRCLINTAKALVPFHSYLRLAQYKFRPYQEDSRRDAWTIQQGLRQIDWIRSVTTFEGKSALEVGSGWAPIIPVLFSLAGIGKVYLTDLNRLMTLASFQSGLRSLRRSKALVMERIPLSEGVFEERIGAAEKATSLDEVLRHFRLEYLAPCDCQALKLEAASVDFVISRAVLEHIPPGVIQGIFLESARILRPGGIACHIVDNSDHWEHGDKTLSRINFLRYSDGVFKWTHINSLDYQNRLRHSEYIGMLHNARLSVIGDDPEVDPKALADTKVIPLDEKFRKFTPEDLATVTSYLLAQRPVAAN